MLYITKKLDNFAVEDSGKFEGYVSVFGNVDLDNEVIAKDAFSSTIETKIYPLLADHIHWKVIGGFRVRVDDYGLKMTDGFFDIENNETAREKYSLAKKGVLDSFSAGFISLESSYQKVNNKSVKVFTKAKLMEGSIVTFPANPEAKLTEIKSVSDLNSIREVEKFLSSLGLSGKEAKSLISKIKADVKRDAEIEAIRQQINNFNNQLKDQG